MNPAKQFQQEPLTLTLQWAEEGSIPSPRPRATVKDRTPTLAQGGRFKNIEAFLCVVVVGWSKCYYFVAVGCDALWQTVLNCNKLSQILLHLQQFTAILKNPQQVTKITTV